MPAFRFRLQRLLDLSATEQQARARDLGAARAREAEAASALEVSAQHRQTQLNDLRREPAEGQLDLDAWEAGRAHYQGARHAEHAAAARLNVAEAGVSEARGAFVKARQEGAALEHLRERRQQVWRAEQAAADQALLDEVAGRVGGEAGKGRG